MTTDPSTSTGPDDPADARDTSDVGGAPLGDGEIPENAEGVGAAVGEASTFEPEEDEAAEPDGSGSA